MPYDDTLVLIGSAFTHGSEVSGPLVCLMAGQHRAPSATAAQVDRGAGPAALVGDDLARRADMQLAPGLAGWRARWVFGATPGVVLTALVWTMVTRGTDRGHLFEVIVISIDWLAPRVGAVLLARLARSPLEASGSPRAG